MTVVVGWSDRPEGIAALQHAVAECELRRVALVVVPNTAEDRPTLPEQRITVEFTVAEPSPEGQIAERLLEVAESEGAEAIVVGLRRRSPTGKLLLGFNAQRILLDAACPVHAVKAAEV